MVVDGGCAQILWWRTRFVTRSMLMFAWKFRVMSRYIPPVSLSLSLSLLSLLSSIICYLSICVMRIASRETGNPDKFQSSKYQMFDLVRDSAPRASTIPTTCFCLNDDAMRLWLICLLLDVTTNQRKKKFTNIHKKKPAISLGCPQLRYRLSLCGALEK